MEVVCTGRQRRALREECWLLLSSICRGRYRRKISGLADEGYLQSGIQLKYICSWGVAGAIGAWREDC